MAEGQRNENEEEGEQQQQEQQQEQQHQIKHGEESVKLFVGQVPKHMTEEQLLSLFKEFALVDQVNVIKDKATKASKGCCFVTCPSREEADKAVFACHNKKIIPAASSPLQVKYADGELERLEHKLFVGMLPKNVLDDEVSALFSQYGMIKELQILRGTQQTSKGYAFLKYETKEQALAAIDAVNEKIKMEGSDIPLVVKWADTEKERQARRAQKTPVANVNDPSQNSLFGAMPLGHVPPYNGYGYQGPRSYGLMPYRLPSVRPDISSGVAPRSFVVPNIRFPLTYPVGMPNQRPLNNSPGSLPLTVPNSPGGTSPGAGSTSGSQIEGPPGANLFIYHIPLEYGDVELANAFQPFGKVLSAKVFVDKTTGLSKCFGFVSYDTATAAQTAISKMNGVQLFGKKLKVQLKRANKQNKPYQFGG
ncbi:RNA-binding protein BRN1-like isoform X2 [Silene latifolia]|uniref:RNA-binding protein BRN1-like isoform X2 n=1 Tax=Silene latifolia TaxID=37657 RepID=UPI003D770A6B